MVSEVVKEIKQNKDAVDTTAIELKLYDILQSNQRLSTALEHFSIKKLIEEITYTDNKEEIIRNVLELFKFYDDAEVKIALNTIATKTRELLEIFKEKAK
jgi:hypothetical protein